MSFESLGHDMGAPECMRGAVGSVAEAAEEAPRADAQAEAYAEAAAAPNHAPAPGRPGCCDPRAPPPSPSPHPGGLPLAPAWRWTTGLGLGQAPTIIQPYSKPCVQLYPDTVW